MDLANIFIPVQGGRINFVFKSLQGYGDNSLLKPDSILAFNPLW
jgi:hypothetical protein